MKAEELRIGNLVEYFIDDLLDEKKQWWEVNALDINDIADIERLGCELAGYRPIPLTEEWLLKFGFSKDNDRSSYYVNIETGYNKFDLMWFDKVYLKSRYDQENLLTQSLPHIKHVHQLQNLYFALTNQELTLKL